MQNAQKAAYARKAIGSIDGYSIPFSAPKFNEFVVRGSKSASEVLEAVREKGIIGGLALSKYYSGHDSDFLVCVTETSSKANIDGLTNLLANA